MKLSEFKDEQAIEVVAKLLIPIGNIASNQENAAAKGKSKLEFASTILRNNAAEVKDMFAILNNIDPAEYHCSAASVLANLLDMLNDPELMQLFGLQSKKTASSGSVSESTEAHEA